MKRTPLVMAIASSGGHWVQLRCLRTAFPADRTIWVSTRPHLATEVMKTSSSPRFHAVPDSTRWDRLRLAWSFLRILLVVVRHRPTHIVTTGAAPGLFAIIAGRLVRAKTLWIDSMANAESISMSGQLALRWADEVWVQWPECTSKSAGRKQPHYRGGIL